MTQKQLKELERLNERWANDPPDGLNEYDIARDVMDLLPEVLTHIKELERGIEGMHQSVQSMEMVRKAAILDLRNASELQARLNEAEQGRDAALKAAAELLSWATMLANNARDCAPTGRLAVTLHRWFERDHQPDKPWGSGSDYVPKSELDTANAKCAEMRGVIYRMYHWEGDERSPSIDADAKHALSADCGNGYHADSEWEPVVEALRMIANVVPNSYAGQKAEHALAHAERITGGAQ